MFRPNARFENFVTTGVNPYPVLETIPFVASALFAVLFAVISEQPNSSQFYSFWSVAAILCILSFAVWYSGAHKKYISPNRLVIEVLETARASIWWRQFSP